MNALYVCPCCSSPLLHHVNSRGEYWFCRHCWQEMPDVELKQERKVQSHRKNSLVREFTSLNQSLLVGRQLELIN